MQRKCSGFPVFMRVHAGHRAFMGGFESFWGRFFYPRLELVFSVFRRGLPYLTTPANVGLDWLLLV